jgi:lauroyl/myristoyl acyltransferase
MFLLKNYNFSKNLDLLPWVQKNLLPSKIKKSTCKREGELKIKFEKERMQAIERNLENFYKKKKNWRGRRTVRKRDKRSKREGDPKKII